LGTLKLRFALTGKREEALTTKEKRVWRKDEDSASQSRGGKLNILSEVDKRRRGDWSGAEPRRGIQRREGRLQDGTPLAKAVEEGGTLDFTKLGGDRGLCEPIREEGGSSISRRSPRCYQCQDDCIREKTRSAGSQ